ncbi:MAG: hypothetical protein WCI22_10125 [Actinomycetota bacterium]
MHTRNSFWSRTFDEARNTGVWVMVPRHYTRATASQLASDIGCAHRRTPERRRVRGIEPGERWETRWAPAPPPHPGDFVVWIRLDSGCEHS